MEETVPVGEKYLKQLFAQKYPEVAHRRPALYEEMLGSEELTTAAAIIAENQQKIATFMNERIRAEDIKETRLMLPNAKAGQAYSFVIPISETGWDDIVDLDLEGLEELGLNFDSQTETISGTPNQSGDFKIKMRFKLHDEGNTYERDLMFIVNPDPKSLWKDIPSATGDKFWKEDNVAAAGPLGDKHIVAASRRGRSHANVGSFRDDHFAYEHFEDNGWSVVAVADGAGSAKYSRMGSRVACEEVVKQFAIRFTDEVCAEFDEIIINWQDEKSENGQQDLSKFVSKYVAKIAYETSRKLKEVAEHYEAELRDFNTTLIFSLLKKIPQGYAVLSFGVGDCPIVLLNREMTDVHLLNKMDVGEFGGGTRFITMPSIFQAEDFYKNRFSFKIVGDFSYLMLMTDGIYDPKFEVEANLEKIEKWQAFMADLRGENVDNKGVDFSADNENIAGQLSDWMNFWSVGNHDDRTLAVVF